MKVKKFHPGIPGMYRRFESCATAISESIYRALGSPLAIECYGLSRKGEFMGLVSKSLDPSSYTDADLFRRDYLAVELMSKFDSYDLGIDRDEVALQKFIQAEDQCRSANKRLSVRYETGLITPYSPESFIWTAREKIAALLGPFDWDKASAHFAFGPGASTSVRRERGDAYFKYGVVRPHTTKANSLLSLAAVKACPNWFNHLLGARDSSAFLNLPAEQQAEELFEFVPGNKVTTVPKNAKTNRVIAIEPDLNMYVQKGIGRLIRQRLKRVHIDLDDQCVNQRMAKESSISGSHATIDLSMASDTVSLELCSLLLPHDWFDAIKQCRSERGVMPDGKLITYQKVSSMGNGFTFELESLLFWALCSSVVALLRPATRRIAVYGDDLLVPVEICHTVLWLLKYAGFTPNAKKTFLHGPFRESCGKHYFLGTDVTPFYIKKDVVSSDRLITVANRIRDWSVTSFGLDALLKVSYLTVVDLLPKSLRRPTIPRSLGDIALWGDFDEVCPQKAGRGQEGWKALGFQQDVETIGPEDLPLLIRNLKVLGDNIEVFERESIRFFTEMVKLRRRDGSEIDSSKVNLKPRRVKWRVVRPLTVQWESFGGWLPL
jgi:hypothetical protein